MHVGLHHTSPCLQDGPQVTCVAAGCAKGAGQYRQNGVDDAEVAAARCNRLALHGGSADVTTRDFLSTGFHSGLPRVNRYLQTD